MAIDCFKLVTGGQTGVDRGALDAALDLGIPVGGWCPADRMAEDGPIAAHYPLRALPGAGYRERTLANVRDSDATVIVHFGELSGGTEITRRDCRELGRPCLLLDATALSPEASARRLLGWLRANPVRILNVAGPRASEDDRGYAYTQAVLRALWSAAAPRGAAGTMSRRTALGEP
jgi:hypothetical protein